MKKATVIFKQLYLEKVKSKMFILATVFMVLMILSVGFIPSMLNKLTSDYANIKIVNNSSISDSNLIFSKENKFMNTDIQLSITNKSQKDLEKDIIEGKIDGYLIINDISNGTQVIEGEYHSNKLNNQSINSFLGNLISVNNSDYVGKVFKDNNIPDDINVLQLKAIDSSNKSSNTSEHIDGRMIIVYVFVLFIYTVVLMYANTVATEISKEKNSKMLEVIISVVDPKHHFLAKLLAVFMVSLTQVSILTITSVLMIKYSKADFIAKNVNSIIDTIPSSLWLWLIVLFIICFMGYLTICALLGALTSKVEEVGNYILPVILILFVTLILTIIGISNPDLSVIKITSFIPLLSPLVMFVRISLSDVSNISIMISVVLQIVFNIVVFVYASWLYKGSVLSDNSDGNLIKNIKGALLVSKS